MYNGIGLQTARGSGTNGYVQSNLANLLFSKNKVEYNSEADIAKAEAEVNKAPNAELLDHEYKRAIEIKCAEFEDLMEGKGFNEEEIRSKVSEYRKLLFNEFESGKLNMENELDIRNSHARAKVAKDNRDKMRFALGIDASFIDGSSLEKLKKASEKLINELSEKEKAELDKEMQKSLMQKLYEKIKADKEKKRQNNESSSSSSTTSTSSSDSSDLSSSESDSSASPTSSSSASEQKQKKKKMKKKANSEKEIKPEIKQEIESPPPGRDYYRKDVRYEKKQRHTERRSKSISNSPKYRRERQHSPYRRETSPSRRHRRESPPSPRHRREVSPARVNQRESPPPSKRKRTRSPDPEYTRHSRRSDDKHNKNHIHKKSERSRRSLSRSSNERSRSRSPPKRDGHRKPSRRARD